MNNLVTLLLEDNVSRYPRTRRWEERIRIYPRGIVAKDVLSCPSQKHGHRIAIGHNSDLPTRYSQFGVWGETCHTPTKSYKSDYFQYSLSLEWKSGYRLDVIMCQVIVADGKSFRPGSKGLGGTIWEGEIVSAAMSLPVSEEQHLICGCRRWAGLLPGSPLTALHRWASSEAPRRCRRWWFSELLALQLRAGGFVLVSDSVRNI